MRGGAVCGKRELAHDDLLACCGDADGMCDLYEMKGKQMKGLKEVEDFATDLLMKAGLSEGQIVTLRDMGYFHAPASKGHHLAVPGGLMRHSLNVTYNIEKLTLTFGYEWKRPESPYVVGMLHDLVKCKCYKECPLGGYEWVNPGWPGHGEASVMIASHELKIGLTTEEIRAIRHHMGLWDVEGLARKDFEHAVDRDAQAIIITHTADWWASKVDEVEGGRDEG